MFKRVLVAMDLSPATEALVSALPGLKDFGTEELRLVHTTKPVEHPVSRSLRQVEELRTRLKKLAERLEQEGFQVSVDVPSGPTAPEIIREANEWNPDILMVGSRSHTKLYEAFVGSVAWELVRRARRPVLLHRIEASRPDPEAALQSRSSGLPDSVVYATDFSEAAQQAFPWVKALAGLGVPKFTVLHVEDPNTSETREEAQSRLDRLATQLREAGAPEVEAVVRSGSPAEEVLNLGGRNPHSMVVMATQGRGILPEIVLGSESRQVARRAAAPVLLVPARAKE